MSFLPARSSFQSRKPLSPTVLGLALTAGLSISLLSLSAAPPASAQGLMEGVGVMTMQKAMPGADSFKNLTKGYNIGAAAAAKAGAQADAAQSAIPANLKMTMPDGSEAVDPKKAAEAAAKAKADVAIAKTLMAKSNASLSELRQAETRLRAAIAVRNAIWGYTDAGIPILLTDLGTCYERMQQPKTALDCYRRALVYLNKRFGPGSNERMKVFAKMGPLLNQENTPAAQNEVCSIKKQIAAMKERQLGAGNLETLRAKLDWALMAKQLGRPEALPTFHHTLSDLEAAAAAATQSASPADKATLDKFALLRGELLPQYLDLLKKDGKEQETATLLQTYPALAVTAQIPNQSAMPTQTALPGQPQPASPSPMNTVTNPAGTPPATTMPGSSTPVAVPGASTTKGSSAAPGAVAKPAVEQAAQSAKPADVTKPAQIPMQPNSSLQPAGNTP